jgi:2-methylcitrate dehydratase PrpD
MSTPATTLEHARQGVTTRIATLASGLRFEDIPAPAATVARQCLLDWFGVALGGASDDTVRILRDEALEQGGTAQASLVGGPGKLSVLQAALINGTAGHALDYDDVHYAMPGHPTAPVAPAVLALAERDGCSGRDLLTAFVAGVETECRVGRYVTQEHYERGWHATATLGHFAAAAAAARLLGLDADVTATALGIAGTQAAGFKSMFGTMCKPMHAGKAAANGLHAALLAVRGFTARRDVLECAQGFGATQSPVCDEAALDDLDGHFFTRDVLFKFHAACYGTHSTIEAARSLVESQQIRPEDISAVEIRIRPRYLKMCAIPRPATGLEAKFSLAMTSAMALTGVSTAAPERYDETLCATPALTRLVQRTTVTPSDEFDDATSEIIVSTGGGVVYRMRGDVSRPAEDLVQQSRRLREKFDALVTPVLGVTATAELADMLERIDELADVRALMALARS